jgi:hypothetical protein
VTKGVWDVKIVLKGKGKLRFYWPTDINTKSLGSRQLKVPMHAKRPEDFRPYDEALVRLADVQWENLYIGDTDAIDQIGGSAAIRQAAWKYKLPVSGIFPPKMQPTQDAPEESDPLTRRYVAQEKIKAYTQNITVLKQHLMSIANELSHAKVYQPQLGWLWERDLLSEKDTTVAPNGQPLYKFPELRVQAMQKTVRIMTGIARELQHIYNTYMTSNLSSVYR